MLRPRARADEGISLVEILVAIALLAIASVAILPVIANSAQESQRNQRTAIASDIANSILDDIRTTTSIGSSCTVLTGYVTSPTDMAVLGHRGFTKRITVTCPTTVAPAGLGLVTVTIKDTSTGTPTTLATATTLVSIS